MDNHYYRMVPMRGAALLSLLFLVVFPGLPLRAEKVPPCPPPQGVTNDVFVVFAGAVGIVDFANCPSGPIVVSGTVVGIAVGQFHDFLGSFPLGTKGTQDFLFLVTDNSENPIGVWSASSVNSSQPWASASVAGNNVKVTVDLEKISNKVGNYDVDITVSGAEAGPGATLEPGVGRLRVQITSAVILVDPVDSGLLRNQPGGVATDPALLSQVGVPVLGVSADGVTRVIVRIPATQAGDSLNVAVLNDLGVNSQSVAEDGGLFPIGTDPSNAASSLPMTAVDTPIGPMAFALYIAPANFSRGAGDTFAGQRAIDLRVTSDSDPTLQLSTTVQVFRPPIVLVHGLWDSADGWASFQNNTNFSLFTLYTANYNVQVPGVTATDPSYVAIQLDFSQVSANTLGLAFNAPAVDAQIRQFIADFKNNNNIAAVRADVVGHSMGGIVTRTTALSPFFLGSDTYQQGPINKLITIGTPHLGSPLAIGLLNGNNDCVRRFLALSGNISFNTVTANGATVIGAINDMRGDGNGGQLSLALTNLMTAPGLPFPISYMAGLEDQANLSGLNCTVCHVQLIRTTCGTLARDPLALALTPQGWPTVFGQDSDSIVPLSSELNGSSGFEVVGVIHSPGVLGLDFNPPTEKDSVPIQSKVLDLLNEAGNGPDFH